ncbi:MAG: AmmeMemoRadiSam system protein B [bacterium]
MDLVHKEDVRPAVVANAFYPGDPTILSAEIENMMKSSETIKLKGEIKALVCPHAGYMYSGRVAAVGYKLLKGCRYSIVAIISPSHREYFPGVSVFNGKGYETPLGMMSVASEIADALIEQSDRVNSSWAGHRLEHALEVQLPFLQTVLPDVSIIPIVMGDQDKETCQLLGEALAKVLKGIPALVVASSDLSHYHPYSEAITIDGFTSKLIESYDEISLGNALNNGTCEACGGGPIISAMVASKQAGANQARVLIYKNSGDITGEHTTVVGYLSAAFGNLN